jgi:hypothetical protein
MVVARGGFVQRYAPFFIPIAGLELQLAAQVIVLDSVDMPQLMSGSGVKRLLRKAKQSHH